MDNDAPFTDPERQRSPERIAASERKIASLRSAGPPLSPGDQHAYDNMVSLRDRLEHIGLLMLVNNEDNLGTKLPLHAWQELAQYALWLLKEDYALNATADGVNLNFCNILDAAWNMTEADVLWWQLAGRDEDVLGAAPEDVLRGEILRVAGEMSRMKAEKVRLKVGCGGRANC